jgi:hypothetical protein
VVSAPHPLAECLIERLHSRPKSWVLDFASGSGRNRDALRRAGFSVVAIDDRAAGSAAPFAGVSQHFSAAISTHGLLHGTRSTIAARVRAICEHLDGGGLLYATFGSTSDSRFGRGRRLDASTYAPSEGDERGIPHAYFGRDELRELFESDWEIESLNEHRVDEVAGSWAHRERPLAGAVHWFAIGRKR